MNIYPLAVAAVLAAPIALAQDGVTRFLPEKPMVVFEMDGAPKLKQRFDGTNFASMMQAKEMEEIFKGIEGLIEEEAGGMPPAIEAMIQKLSPMLDSYSGRMSMGARIEAGDDSPRFIASMVMAPDGATDFAKVVQDIAEVVNDADDMEFTTRAIADGSDAELVGIKRGMSVMMPRVIDDHMVMAFGHIDDFVGTLGAVEGGDDRVSKQSVRLALYSELWGEAIKAMDASDDFEAQMIAAALEPVFDLLDGVNEVSFDLKPAGEFVEWVSELKLDPANTKLLDLLTPKGKERVDLIDFAPRDTQDATAASIDFDKVLELISEMVAGTGESFEDAEDEFAEMVGVELRADLFDHFDGSILALNESGGEDLDEVAMTFVLGVKDSGALERSFDTILKGRGLHAARKTKEYRDQTVSELNIFGMFQLSWAFTDSAMVLGFGTHTGRSVRGVIDSIADKKKGENPPAWPEPISKRLARSPQDWQWVSVTNLGDDVDLIAESVEIQFEQLGDAPDGLVDIVNNWVKLLSDNDLLAYVTTVSFDRDRIVSRTIW